MNHLSRLFFYLLIPIAVLSSSFHNRLNRARILVVPLSSVIDNTALHRMVITANDTRHSQIIKIESDLLFDYTTMVSPKYLKQTQDGLQHDVFKQVLIWWHHYVKSIVSDV
ncbi:hypothetical protein I4U23_027060 [Adineta vaga]|nr:hypothetical protein I4U23_027060 [Adineta vaga]